MDILRIGILGCSGIVDTALLAPARRLGTVEVTAIAARDPARGRAYARDHGIPAADAGYAALIANPSVDAVYIALPNSLHCEWAIAAMTAGKSVLCEKPLASNAAQAAQLAEVARRTGVVLMEAMHWRHHPVARRMDEILASGTIGPVERIEAELLVPAGIVQADNIRFRRDLAGGATMDTGCYCVNFANFVARTAPVAIDEAVAMHMSADIDGAMTAHLRYAGDLTASVRASLAHDGPFTNGGSVTGRRGRLVVENPFMPGLGARITIETGSGTTHEDLPMLESYDYQLEAFVAAVAGAAGVVTDAAEAVRTMATIDAIYRAAGMSPRD